MFGCLVLHKFAQFKRFFLACSIDLVCYNITCANDVKSNEITLHITYTPMIYSFILMGSKLDLFSSDYNVKLTKRCRKNILTPG